jgi:hypothetical protein
MTASEAATLEALQEQAGQAVNSVLDPALYLFALGVYHDPLQVAMRVVGLLVSLLLVMQVGAWQGVLLLSRLHLQRMTGVLLMASLISVSGIKMTTEMMKGLKLGNQNSSQRPEVTTMASLLEIWMSGALRMIGIKGCLLEGHIMDGVPSAYRHSLD